jgi:hypothetical protein
VGHFGMHRPAGHIAAVLGAGQFGMPTEAGRFDLLMGRVTLVDFRWVRNPAARQLFGNGSFETGSTTYKSLSKKPKIGLQLAT